MAIGIDWHVYEHEHEHEVESVQIKMIGALHVM